MKKRPLFVGLLLGICAMLAVAATRPLTQSLDLKISNATDTVGLTIQKGGSLTSNQFEIYSGSTLTFAVPASGVLPITYGGTGGATAAAGRLAQGIQAGTLTTSANGTVTNTFATAFTVAPYVVTTLQNSTGPTNNVVSVTTSNFVYSAGSASKTAHWIAIGTP